MVNGPTPFGAKLNPAALALAPAFTIADDYSAAVRTALLRAPRRRLVNDQ
jgi:hypothetical protein